MDGVVLRGQDVPARLRLPRGVLDLLLLEQVGDGRIMGCPDELLFFLGKVSREKLSTVRKHPGAPVRDFDAREDIRRILVKLLLYGFADIRGDRSDVNKSGHAIIDARGRNGSASVGMAHEEDRAADTVERALHRSDVPFKRVEAILNGDHLMPIRLQCGDDLAKSTSRRPRCRGRTRWWVYAD